MQRGREANSEIEREKRWLKQKAGRAPSALLLTNENLLLCQEQRKEVMVFSMENGKSLAV